VADTWDPAKDEKEGNACRAYGAAGIMRVPGRVHVTWQDENTLKIETDAGTQTRLLHFGDAQPPPGEQGWQGKVAAAFTNSAGVNGDKLNALTSIAALAAQHGMHWVNLGLMPGWLYSSTGSPDDLNRLGGFLGAMAQSPSDLGADVAPSEADLRTAEHLGRRVAQTTSQLARGRAATQADLAVA